MKDQWPPSAPAIRETFRKAHDIAPPPPERAPVTKQQVENLERLHNPTTTQLVFSPPGMKPCAPLDPKREARLEKMRQRLREGGRKGREDFQRTVGNEM